MFKANRFILPAIGLLLAPSLLEADALFKFNRTQRIGNVVTPIVADVNGDGNNDLLLVAGGIEVLLGAGDGTFVSDQTYYGSLGIDALAAGDFNGDGKVDLAVIDSAGVEVLLGAGDGTFGAPQTIGSGTSALSIGDINGDGKLDIVAISSGAIAVWLGNGDGTFQAAKLSNPGGTFYQIALADVNLDHKQDVFVLSSGSVGVMLSNGDGTLQPVRSIDSFAGGWMGTGDVSGDGKPDLITLDGTDTVRVYLGNGDGTFQAAASYSAGGKDPRAMLVADANNDGRADVLVAECTKSQYSCYVNREGKFVIGKGEIGILISNGDGTLGAAQFYETGGKDGRGVALGDLNNDGRVDLIGVNSCEHAPGCDDTANIGISFATGKISASEALISSMNPSVHGQSVTFTATVSSAVKSRTPTGNITFKLGNKKLAEVALVNGVATYTTDSLPVGSDGIDALYAPSGDWYKTEASIVEAVNP